MCWKLHTLVVVGCLALLLALQAGAADSTEVAPHRKAKSPTGAMIRSMLVPGWGQVYNGKYLKALVYAGTQLSFLYGAHVQNNRYHHYRDIGYNVDADFYQSDRNRLLWWLFGITLVSMGDAFVDAHLSQFDVSDDLSARIEPHVDPDQAAIVLSLSIFFDHHVRNP